MCEVPVVGWYVDKEYANNKKSLDRVPLQQFAWVLPGPDIHDGPDIPHNGQAAPADGPDSTSNGQQAPVDGLGPQSNGQQASLNESKPSLNAQEVETQAAGPVVSSFRSYQSPQDYGTPQDYQSPQSYQSPVQYGQGMWQKAPADGPISSFNGQQASANGQYHPSNGASANGQQAPANGSTPVTTGQHQSSNGASPNGQHAPQNGSAPPINGQHPSSTGEHSSPGGQPESVYGPQPPSNSPPQPTQGQLQDLNDLRAVLNCYLPEQLATRLWKTAQVCCVSQSKMSLDAAQNMISASLDQAEALQAQIITDKWYGSASHDLIHLIT